MTGLGAARIPRKTRSGKGPILELNRPNHFRGRSKKYPRIQALSVRHVEADKEHFSTQVNDLIGDSLRRCLGRNRNLDRCRNTISKKWFCHLHKRQPLIWIFTLLFTVLGGSSSIYSVLFQNNKSDTEPSQSINGVIPIIATSHGYDKEMRVSQSKEKAIGMDYFKAAERDFSLKNYQDAAINYQKCIDIRATKSSYLNLGVSLMYISDFKGAQLAFITGLKIDGGESDVEYKSAFFNNLGYLYAIQKQWDAALEKFKDAKQLEPENIYISSNLAYLAMQQGNDEEALALYIDAVSRLPSLDKNDPNNSQYSIFHYNLGNTYAKLGRFEEALDPLRQAIRIDPGYGNAYNELGNVYIGLARMSLARKAFEEGLLQDSTFPPFYKNLAIVALHEGNVSEAIQSLEKAQQFYDDDDWMAQAEATYWLAVAYEKMGQEMAACQYLRQFSSWDKRGISEKAHVAMNLSTRLKCKMQFQ